MRNTERRVSPLATGRRKGPVSAEPSLFDAERTQKNLPFPFNKKKPIAKQAADPNRVAEAARAPGDKENNDGGGNGKRGPRMRKKHKNKTDDSIDRKFERRRRRRWWWCSSLQQMRLSFPSDTVWRLRRTKAGRASQRERKRERERGRKRDRRRWMVSTLNRRSRFFTLS